MVNGVGVGGRTNSVGFPGYFWQIQGDFGVESSVY